MPIINVKAVVTLNKLSMLPDDAVQNTFAIETEPEVVDFPFVDVHNALVAFYTTTFGITSIQQKLAASVHRGANAHQIDQTIITDHLDGSSAGPPDFSAPWSTTAGASGAGDVPAECAAVLTLYAEGRDEAPVEIGGDPPTRPKQNRTGHLYLGPLQGPAFEIVGTEVRVAASMTTVMIAAIENLIVDLHDIDCNLCVWSRKLAAMNEVVGGHVDNAPDTQRRRGVGSSLRVTFP